MNLIERYAAEVGKHLPARGRADIQTELRSTLEDMLEDRARKAGKPADEAMTLALLREYGAPAQVAAGYTGPRYLIGPKMFPFFWLVVQIVITVLFAVSMGAFILAFATGSMTGEAFAKALGQFLLQFVGGALSAFGNIALIFAILERVVPVSELEKEARDWDPAELAKEPDPDKVKHGELIFGTLFTVLALMVLNIYPDMVGIGYSSNGQWIFTPILSEAFFRYLPWINILGMARSSFNLWQLRVGTWNLGTRITDMLIEIGGIALAVAMLAGPSLITASAEALPQLSEALGVFQASPLLVLGIIIIVSIVEVVKSAVKIGKQLLTK